ncbi:unnamed protein product [Owenia fusiformis]|uniref:Uncharacterized protein n=1 Tax=Owenia fusiformis TaxID=6347 RepID=A0A8S4N286_OWEFU|nr:unnamed protein product [Owenia fusiformis]
MTLSNIYFIISSSLMLKVAAQTPLERCHFQEGSNCCRFEVKHDRAGRPRDDSVLGRQEQLCPTGQAWDDDICECALHVPGCDPAIDCSIDQPNISNSNTTPLIPIDVPRCPDDLGIDECCLEELVQVYGVVNNTNSTSYWINRDYSKFNTCPSGQIFNLSSCCCEGDLHEPRIRYCKYWPFDEEYGTRDIYQDTATLNRGARLGEGHNNKNGLFIPKKRAMKIYHYVGTPFRIDGTFSVSFWVKTSASDSANGTVILSNGDSRIQPSMIFFTYGNTVSGGIYTQSEKASSNPVPTADFLFQDLDGDGWHFIAFVYEDPNTHLYTDDTVTSFTQQSGKIVRNRCLILAGGSNTYQLNLDELVFCDFAFNGTDVDQLRDHGKIPTKNSIEV